MDFLKRLMELHGSGMPVADSVKLLNQRLSDPKLKDVARFLWKELAEGRTLSRAMRALPQYFSESSTFVIEAGEATGNVGPILKKIIVYLEEKREIRSKVLTSMAYPCFVGLVAFGVVVFFIKVLLPQIKSMLDKMGGEMNFLAKLLINSSDFVKNFGPFVLIGLIISLAVAHKWRQDRKRGDVGGPGYPEDSSFRQHTVFVSDVSVDEFALHLDLERDRVDRKLAPV